jgi:hypothetical protein
MDAYVSIGRDAELTTSIRRVAQLRRAEASPENAKPLDVIDDPCAGVVG